MEKMTADESFGSSQETNTAFDVSGNWTSLSFDKELHTASSISKENLRALRALESEITKLRIFHAQNPGIGICGAIKDCQAAERNNIAETFHNCAADFASLCQEERQIIAACDEAERKIKEIDPKVAESQESVKAARKVYKQHLAALKLAKQYYNEGFGMTIKIADKTDDVITAIVFFDAKELFPIKFTLNATSVIGVDASSVLTPKQEKFLMEKFGSFDNIPALVCTLRSVVLKKL